MRVVSVFPDSANNEEALEALCVAARLSEYKANSDMSSGEVATRVAVPRLDELVSNSSLDYKTLRKRYRYEAERGAVYASLIAFVRDAKEDGGECDRSNKRLLDLEEMLEQLSAAEKLSLNAALGIQRRVSVRKEVHIYEDSTNTVSV